MPAMPQTHSTPDKLNPSMWINDHPQATAYFRSTTLWARLLARLPGWLGGRPLHSVTMSAVKGPLTSHTSTALPLRTQLLLARGKGLTDEVQALEQRIAQSGAATARIRRVA